MTTTEDQHNLRRYKEERDIARAQVDRFREQVRELTSIHVAHTVAVKLALEYFTKGRVIEALKLLGEMARDDEDL